MDSARAVVPGHVTAFFSPQPAPDPALAGARGGGIALTHGVEMQARRVANGAGGLWLDGQRTTITAVSGVLDALDVSAVRLEARTRLPLGAGFGVSGAAALGTALTVGALSETEWPRRSLVAIAHVADVEAESGLGDVVAQAHGGVPLRLEPGAPPHAQLESIETPPRQLEYLSRGALSTAAVLGGDTRALEAAGRRALAAVRATPTVEELMAAGARFGAQAGLVSPALEEILAAVTETGGIATMAMLGETVVALDTGLSDAGYEAVGCEIDPAGARLTQTEGDFAHSPEERP